MVLLIPLTHPTIVVQVEKKTGAPDETLGEALVQLKEQVTTQRHTWLQAVQGQLGDARQAVFASGFSFQVWLMQEEAILDDLPTGFKPFGPKA
jgi:hypothetical protein